MAPLFHIALAADWKRAQESGVYTTSTRDRTLAEVGFIHASRADQWPGVHAAYYADVAEPLLLLQVDPDRLSVPVVEEPAEPGGTETFPHIYGPLPVAAVVRVLPIPAPTGATAPTSTGSPALPTSTRPSHSAHDGGTATSFSRVFFAEMFGNAALVLLVFAAGALGILIGSRFGDALAPLFGALVGLAVGGVLARLLYLRRHARA